MDHAILPGRLAPLLDPRSIVIVGASPNASRTGGIPLQTHLNNRYPPERLLLVNPKYPEIAGLPCYPDIAALPWAPELAVLAIRADEVLATLRACHTRGIRAAVVFASGFAEEGTAASRALQDDLLVFVRESGMLVSGPNCLGHANFKSRTFPTFLTRIVPAIKSGPVALLTQSGNMASVMLQAGIKAGLAFSYLVNTGNEACIELAEFLEHFADDAETGAVICYAEQLRDGPRFMAVASRLRALDKPIFMLKSGGSEKGAEATASHTAAMAGAASSYQAAFRQLGIESAFDPFRLVDLAYLWRFGSRPTGKRVCIVSLSGAACALLADGFSAEGIEVPTFGATTQAALRAVVPSYGMVSNPVDLTGQITNDLSLAGAAFAALTTSPDVDAVVIYITGYLLDLMADALIAAAALSDKLLVVIDTTDIATSHARLQAAGIAVIGDMNRALAATSSYLRWSSARTLQPWLPFVPDATRPVRVFPEIVAARAAGRALLSEVEAKSVLAALDLPMVPERVARNEDEAAAIALAFGGAVVVKVLSAEIAHKSDIGGVCLNVNGEAAARAAFQTVTGNALKHRPDARVEGAVIQPMIREGQSVLLGITRDAVFGPMMTVGLGGVLTELYQDVARRVLPVDAGMAEQMLRELKSFPLLDGFRGTPPVDRAALIALMVKLSDAMLWHGVEIAELELNPVLVLPARQGVLAVDALIRLVALPTVD